MISKIAHNEAIIRQAEAAINALVDMVKREGGEAWIQSADNPEHFYRLTGRISVSFFAPVQKINSEE